MHAGTPIQNNVPELFSLMNFVNPRAYPTLKLFTDRYGGGKNGKGDHVVPTVSQIKELQV